MLIGVVSEYYWASMSGTTTRRHPTASCTSGVDGLLGTDEWKGRCNFPPSGAKFHLRHLPISDIGDSANRIKFRHEAFERVANDINYTSGTNFSGFLL